MAGNDKATCTKCGKTKRISSDFFLLKNSEPCEMCKNCLTMYIDNQDPETFLWILEKFDVPYVESKWIDIYNTQYKKNPGAMGPKSVLGRYLREMKLSQWAKYTYADSDKLNFEHSKKTQGSLNENQIAQLQEKLEKGEISQAEFDTLTMPADKPAFVPNISQETEDKIREQLTDEDYEYLLLKWGEHFRPSQWVRMEELYSAYEAEYELNADRSDVLKKICKVSLQMDEALELGDVATLDKLQRAYENLRKSAKFTEAQNKEDNTRELDSIGELVAFVEREGGAIPLFRDNPAKDYQEDKIDFCIKDIQNYINHLVREELGLGDLIETYIENLQNNKIETVEDIIDKGFDDDEDTLTAEDVEAFAGFQADEIEKEAQALLEEFGDA